MLRGMHCRSNVHGAYKPHSAPRPGCNLSPSGPARQPTSSGCRRWKRNCCCRNSANCRNSAWTGGIALVVRLRGIGRLVILLLGVIGLLVLVVGFFLLLVLGSRGLRRLFFAWLLFVFILYRCGGPFRRTASLLCNAGTSKLRCRKAHQKRNDNSLCSHTDLPVHETGRWTLAISNARLAFTSARGASSGRGRRRPPRGRYRRWRTSRR